MEALTPTGYFYLCLFMALILPKVPVLGRYFNVFNTLVHENGHAIMALITRGKVKHIRLFADTSGTTTTASKHAISHFLTALAGYPASGAAALLLFHLVHTFNSLTLIIAISAFILLNLLLFVRNTYGILWLVSFGALLYLLYYLDIPLAMYLSVCFFAGILFWQSLITPLYLIYLAAKTPKNAGDATSLAKITGVHPLIWSILLFGSTLALAWLTIQKFP